MLLPARLLLQGLSIIIILYPSLKKEKNDFGVYSAAYTGIYMYKYSTFSICGHLRIKTASKLRPLPSSIKATFLSSLRYKTTSKLRPV